MNLPTTAATPRLVFRTRATGDIILCDYCQNRMCGWLDFSPENYPKRCPGAREFRIADEEVTKEEFLRRTAVARRVGIYLPTNRSWHLDVSKAKGMDAKTLGGMMDEVNSWSLKNRLTLCKLVEYLPGKDSRAALQETLEIPIRTDRNSSNP